MWLLTNQKQTAIFTGDCVFHGGVGKFFEGSPAEMQLILQSRDKMIPDDCLVFYGHDYGLRNLNWAAFIMNQAGLKGPRMEKLAQAYTECTEKKKQGFASTGFKWSHERDVNLFILASISDDHDVKQVMPYANAVEGVARLRADRTRHDGVRQNEQFELQTKKD